MSVFNLFLEPIQRLYDYFESHRGFAVALLAVAILVVGSTVAIAFRPPVLAPLIESLHAVYLRTFSVPVTMTRYFTDSAPGPRVMALELELAKLREAARENARLRSLLGYAGPPGYQIVTGRVVGLDLEPLRGVAWVDVDPRQGVTTGNAVMTVDGLAGVVDRVEGGRAYLRLLRNERTPVSVRAVRTRALGVVTWEPGRSRFRVDHVPYQAELAEGDTLVSSGLGGVFPPGLPVGTVARVESPPEQLLKEVELDPFARFHRLEEVFVLLAESGPPAPRPASVDTLLTAPENLEARP